MASDKRHRDYPPAIDSPCNECPWRTDSARGHLGPHTAAEWLAIVLGEGAIACHKTIVTCGETNEDGEEIGSWDHPKIRQCRGAASFRENILKLPKNPHIAVGPADRTGVIATVQGFLDHHDREDDE